MKKFFLIIFFISIQSFGQQKDPDIVLNNLKDKFKKIHDYTADIRIKIDVDFIKAPESEAKIYFKQPDKIHFESENFALLPKEGINFSPMAFLNGNYTAIFEKYDTVDGAKAAVIKVIPLNDKSNIILTTLWIDQTRDFILKTESTTKTNGTFSLELNYKGSPDSYPLPSLMVFSFNIERNKFSNGMPNNEDSAGEKPDEKKSRTGKVYIYYSNYTVNKGVPDSIFNEKKH